MSQEPESYSDARKKGNQGKSSFFKENSMKNMKPAFNPIQNPLLEMSFSAKKLDSIVISPINMESDS